MKTKTKNIIISIGTLLVLVITGVFISNGSTLQSSVVPTGAQYVRVCGKKLCLGDKEFFVKGANYNGGSYVKTFEKDANGYEHYNFHFEYLTNFDETEIKKELLFLKNNLGINTVRLVGFHFWNTKWALPDGSINPVYLEKIQKFLSIAGRNNIWVEIQLFHVIPVYLKKPDSIAPGSALEKKYFTFLESFIPVLKDNPAILSYEISSEVLIKWGANEEEQNWYKKAGLSFLKRMTDRVRKLDSNHLITSGEVIPPSSDGKRWTWPSPEFAQIEDIDNLNNGQPFSLYDIVDYISPHFYRDPEKDIKTLELISKKSSKPVVLGEFGYGLGNDSVYREPDKTKYANAQKLYFYSVINAVKNYGLSGLMPWDPMPILQLEPGKFKFEDTGVDKSAPNIVIFADDLHPERKITGWHSYSFWIFYHGLSPMPAATVFKNSFTNLVPTDPCIDECQIREKGCQGSQKWSCGESNDGDNCKERMYTDCATTGDTCSNGQCIHSSTSTPTSFRTYGGSTCDNKKDNRCVNGGDDTDDKTTCSDTNDCVYKKTCYKEGTYKDLNGDKKIDGWCMTSDTYKTQWRDCDDLETACNGGCGAKWTTGGESFAFGEYNSGSATECCGDDKNEFYITTNDKSACCDNSKDTIDKNGKCISPNGSASTGER